MQAHGGQMAKRPEEGSGWGTGGGLAPSGCSPQSKSRWGDAVGEAGAQDSVVPLRQLLRKLVIGKQVTQEMLPRGALGLSRQPQSSCSAKCNHHLAP